MSYLALYYAQNIPTMCINQDICSHPNCFGSVDRALARGLKGPTFHSGQTSVAGSSPGHGRGSCGRQPTDESLSHQCIFPLSVSPLPFTRIYVFAF